MEPEGPRKRGSWRPGCLLLVLIALLVLIIALIVLWRSVWWVESGAPLPRGTERRIAAPAGEAMAWNAPVRPFPPLPRGGG